MATRICQECIRGKERGHSFVVLRYFWSLAGGGVVLCSKMPSAPFQARILQGPDNDLGSWTNPKTKKDSDSFHDVHNSMIVLHINPGLLAAKNNGQ